MKLTDEEKYAALDGRRNAALQCIGAYFVRNYDSSVWDGNMKFLVHDFEAIDAGVNKLETKIAMERL